MKNKFAFTLAEILTVLVLLGVVSAITIPSTINRKKTNELKTRFLKTHSSIENTLNIISIENPTYYQYITQASVESYKRPERIIEVIEPYFLVSEKITGRGSTNNIQQRYKNFFGNNTNSNDWFVHGCLILKDGTAIFPDFAWAGGLYIGVDINGIDKGPNKYGHDFFMYEIGTDGNLQFVTNLPGGLGWNNINNANAGLTNTQQAFTNPDYFKNLP